MVVFLESVPRVFFVVFCVVPLVGGSETANYFTGPKCRPVVVRAVQNQVHLRLDFDEVMKFENEVILLSKFEKMNL